MTEPRASMPPELRGHAHGGEVVASRARANRARERLVKAYAEEATALRVAARNLLAADLDTLRREPMVGRGARLRAAEDELDAALAAMDA